MLHSLNQVDLTRASKYNWLESELRDCPALKLLCQCVTPTVIPNHFPIIGSNSFLLQALLETTIIPAVKNSCGNLDDCNNYRTIVIKNYKLWVHYFAISNSIVRKCVSCALSSSNTVIGYKLAFYRENFSISILKHDLKYCLQHVKPEPLSIKRQSFGQCLHELLLAKCSQLIVNWFVSEEIDDLITFIFSKLNYCNYLFSSLLMYMYYGNLLIVLV